LFGPSVRFGTVGIQRKSFARASKSESFARGADAHSIRKIQNEFLACTVVVDDVAGRE
jgi:hypothetical protein